MKKFISFIFVVILFVILSPISFAQETQDIPHFTIILNQVRGPECCDRGSIRWFKQQQRVIQENNLQGNFALRYDAVQNAEYVAAVKADSKSQYGALLEITPELAQAAGVSYKGDPERWYEAQNVYLIGYTQDERKKLIDTYMAAFKTQFEVLPKFSSAWMIDAWSLNYLKKEYGIVAHQITREQFGTDSYTLYGGPVHYPYYPSNNWALIPQDQNTAMPLMIRQTISDPVFIYGDKTDSYTSQPNDYFLRDDTTEYFKHLFYQAHSQNNSYTFALIGLENTMPENVQAEYEVQLRTVAAWQKENENNKTVSIVDFENWRHSNPTPITIYGGATQADAKEQAYWVNTPSYRARVRLSNGVTSITDLRLYDPKFIDPYYTDTAKSLGWWIVPFVLDSSRYFEMNSSGDVLKNDFLKNRPEGLGRPIQATLAQGTTNLAFESTSEGFILSSQNEKLAVFAKDQIQFFTAPDLSQITAVLPGTTEKMETKVKIPLSQLPPPLGNLQWQSEDLTTAWGFQMNGLIWKPFVQNTDLTEMRSQYRSFLFPEKQFEKMDSNYTIFFINNKRAVANRNPVRFVLFPKNSSGDAILLSSYPQVVVEPKISEISVFEQSDHDGKVFIDLKNDKPQKSKVTISHDDYVQELVIYFAPNCKQEVWYCATHPRHAWWFIRTYFDDKAREKADK